MGGDVSVPKWAVAVLCFLATAAVPWAWTLSANVAVIAATLETVAAQQTREIGNINSRIDKLDERVRNLETAKGAAK